MEQAQSSKCSLVGQCMMMLQSIQQYYMVNVVQSPEIIQSYVLPCLVLTQQVEYNPCTHQGNSEPIHGLDLTQM